MAVVKQAEQCAHIKIEFLSEKTGKEIQKNLTEACSGSTVSFNTVYILKWISNDPSGGLPTEPID